MCKCIVVTLLLAVFGLAANSASAAGFSSLEERMSQSEFHAAGLDKLSPTELNALNEWLRTHNAAATTLVMAVILCWMLPDVFHRALLWTRIARRATL